MNKNQVQMYQDECGKIIPHLLTTDPAFWPASLQKYLQRELGKSPSECMEIDPQNGKRFEFDQAVRRWAHFEGEVEVNRWILTQSALPH